MPIPTNPNQPDSKQDWDGIIKPPQIEWMKNDPKTTKHLPLPDSSWIQSVSYDSSTMRMTITTKNGSSWQHGQVYPQQFTDMQLHPSKGSFYTKFIKGQHPITHIIKTPKLRDFPKENKTYGKTKDRFESRITIGRYQSQGRYGDGPAPRAPKITRKGRAR